MTLPLGSRNGSTSWQVGARRRLIAAQRREPDVVRLRAPRTAARPCAARSTRRCSSATGPTFGSAARRLTRFSSSARRHLVAVRERLRRSGGTCRETAPGCPAAPAAAGPSRTTHFGLKARRDGGLARVRELRGDQIDRLRRDDRLTRAHFRMSSSARRTASTASASVAAPRAICASRSAALGRASAAALLSWTALMIMPAPAVKFVAGSIRMKLPVSAVVGVAIEHDRLAGRDRDRADLVQHQAAIDLRADRRAWPASAGRRAPDRAAARPSTPSRPRTAFDSEGC